MSWLSRLLGSGTKGIGSLAKDIREAIKGKELDPNKKLEIAGKLAEVQTKINEAEATHRTVFVAGWRPFIGWVCGLGLLYAVFIEPLLRFVFTVNGWEIEFPHIDTTITMQVLFGMLGLVGARSYEKKNNLTK
jgi:hypothetical protein|tara:strand:+ start:1407 stop:1805 length:399 start_codon:yes stop_codon:yes gene_type:complete